MTIEPIKSDDLERLMTEVSHAEALAKLNAAGHALAAAVRLHVNLCHLTGQHDVADGLVEMFRTQNFDMLTATFDQMAASYLVEAPGLKH